MLWRFGRAQLIPDAHESGAAAHAVQNLAENATRQPWAECWNLVGILERLLCVSAPWRLGVKICRELAERSGEIYEEAVNARVFMFSSEPKLPKYGQNIVLRRLEKGDLDELYTIESDPEVKRYIGGPIRTPREEWVRGMESKLAMSVTYAVLSKDNLRFVGRASVGNYDSDVDREIQVALAKNYQKRHFGREVCKILIRAAFDELAAEQVVGVAHSQNEGSLKLLRFFGFKQAGIVPDQRDPPWQQGHLIFMLARSDYQTSSAL